MTERDTRTVARLQRGYWLVRRNDRRWDWCNGLFLTISGWGVPAATVQRLVAAGQLQLSADGQEAHARPEDADEQG